MASPREDLLRTAGEILGRIDQRQGIISVRIERDDTRVDLAGEVPQPDVVVESPPDLPPMPAQWPPWWLPITEAEDRVLRVASVEHWQKAEDLARKARLRDDNDLRPMLRLMCERGMLESAAGRGFRLKAPPEGQELPAFCGAGLRPDQGEEV